MLPGGLESYPKLLALAAPCLGLCVRSRPAASGKAVNSRRRSQAGTEGISAQTFGWGGRRSGI